MKKTALILVVLVGIIFALSVFQKPVGDVDGNTIRQPQVAVGDTLFAVGVADSYWKRVRGLSGRTSLAPKEGLFFVFSDSDTHGIWMKEMNFPIDILWADESFTIVGLERNVSPNSYPDVFYPQKDALYVLETPANAIGDNVKIGDTIIFYPQQ